MLDYYENSVTEWSWVSLLSTTPDFWNCWKIWSGSLNSQIFTRKFILHIFYIFLVIMVLIHYNCELRTRCVLNFLILSSWYWGWVGYLYPWPKNRNYWIDPEENLVTIISLSRVYEGVSKSSCTNAITFLWYKIPYQTLFLVLNRYVSSSGAKFQQVAS